MSKIDFNFQSAYRAKDTVRIAAESMVNEAKLVEGMISQITEGWTGAGAEAYINYLKQMESDIKQSASRLYGVLNEIDGSINAAYEADRLAREAIEAVAATGAPHTSDSGHIHGGGGREFDAPQSAEKSSGGAGRSFEPVETNPVVEKATGTMQKMANSVLGAMKKKK